MTDTLAPTTLSRRGVLAGAAGLGRRDRGLGGTFDLWLAPSAQAGEPVRFTLNR